MEIRWMIRRDMSEVLAIDQNITEDEIVEHLRARWVIGMVVVDDDAVVGYMIYGLAKNKVSLIRMMVKEDCRRRGVGRAMIEKLKGKLTGQRLRILYAVDETNLAAQLFLRSQGFRAIKIDRRESGDFYLMRFKKARRCCEN